MAKVSGRDLNSRILRKSNGRASKRLIALNLTLFLAAGLLGWQLYRSVRLFKVEQGRLESQPRSIKDSLAKQSLPPAPAPQQYNQAEFAVIDAQNIFAESRNNQKEEVKVAEVVPELKIRPILVGVVINGDKSLATIAEPPAANVPPNTPLSTQVKRIGDVYQGYTIAEINNDRMVLRNGSRQEVISMFESRAALRHKDKTPLIATRVVNFGPPSSNTPAAPAVITSVAQNLGLPSSRTPSSVPALTAVNVNPVQGAQARPGSPMTPVVAGRPSGTIPRGIDYQTNAQVINTPYGPLVTYPP